MLCCWLKPLVLMVTAWSQRLSRRKLAQVRNLCPRQSLSPRTTSITADFPCNRVVFFLFNGTVLFPYVWLHATESLRSLKHKWGDFPVTDVHTKKIITFPCDQHLNLKQMNYVIDTVKNFYKKL